MYGVCPGEELSVGNGLSLGSELQPGPAAGDAAARAAVGGCCM